MSKKVKMYMLLLLVNIIILLACFIFNDMNKTLLYLILGFVMITTPIYLYLNLKTVTDEAKKAAKKQK